MNLEERKSISVLRVFAMVLILLCHIVQENNIPYIQMTAQFLNVGVSIFLILSGYLYGSKDIKESYGSWIIKRAKRILIPLYVFMLYLLNIYLINGNHINLINWIAYIFDLQGFQIYVHGAEHLWYLTIIMICYLITPILNKNKSKMNKKYLKVFTPTLLIAQIIISYFINTQIGIYLIYIYAYILAYIIGYKWNRSISNKRLLMSIVLAGIAILIRLGGKVLFDDTTLYNVIIVGYTQAMIAFSMLYIFIHCGKNLRYNKYIKYIHFISFDIYLVHYMYIVGPLRTMGITNSFIVNTVITLIVSTVTAIILNNICKLIYKFLDNKVLKMNKDIRKNI